MFRILMVVSQRGFFYALVTAKELKTRLHHEYCHLNQYDSLQTILHFHYLNTSGCTTY